MGSSSWASTCASAVSHRIDFQALVGESVWLYPQNDVFTDLADARDREGGDVRFGIRDTRVVDVTSDQPASCSPRPPGPPARCAASSWSARTGPARLPIRDPERERTHYFREYPFAWFGILAEAPPSAPELVYTHSDRGFRADQPAHRDLQRMYFQCDPGGRRKRLVARTASGPNFRPAWPARTASR